MLRQGRMGRSEVGASSFRDGALAPDPESRDSWLDALHRPGMTVMVPSIPRDCGTHATHHKTFFIIFVDAIFTTLFEGPFTNDFEVIAESPAVS